MDYIISFAKPKYQRDFNALNGYNFKNNESLSNRTIDDIIFIKAAARMFNLNCGNDQAVRVV